MKIRHSQISQITQTVATAGGASVGYKEYQMDASPPFPYVLCNLLNLLRNAAMP
jgi:hypothetical protein